MLSALLLLNAVMGGWTIARAMDNLALLHKGARAQAWILWESGAVDLARRDARYGFAEPIPTTREQFADFVLMDSVQRQERVVNAGLVWLGVSSTGLVGLAVWSVMSRKRARADRRAEARPA